MENKYFILMLAICLVLPMISAGSGYKIYTDHVTYDEEVVESPEFWINNYHIDFNGNRVYHIDALRDLYIDENNESNNEKVRLYLPYKVQPDWIQHINHAGVSQGYYFPTNEDWEWEYECEEEDEDCEGYVILRVDKIDEGLGSNTFPIGITGPTWANQGQFFGEFDGVGTNIEINNSNDFNSTNGLTVTAWVSPNDLILDDGDIITKYTATGNQRSWALDINNNKIQWVVSHNGTATNISTGATTIPNNGGWVWIVGRWNGTHITNFLNSIEDDSTPEPMLFIFNSSQDVEMGTDRRSQGMNGSIDEVLIYNRSLSQAEITALFNNYTLTSTGPNRTSIHSTEGLVLDINFDDFSVADNSGQANHGTNTNVSFGEVFSVKNTLVENVDYSILDNLFTILNIDYAWTGIDSSWDYTASTSCSAIDLTNIEEQFGLFATGLLAFLGIIGTILGIVWLVFYVKMLFSKKEGITTLTA